MTDRITTAPAPEQQSNDLNTPWTLGFYRDGTEDVAIIGDANGEVLVTSRGFWRPEGDDPTPPTLAAMRVMNVAPKLLAALEAILPYAKNEISIINLRSSGTAADEEEAKKANAALALTKAAMAEATDDSIGRVEVSAEPEAKHDANQSAPSKQLPPDPDGMNISRAAWADHALQAFQTTTGTDREDALSDLLCDLMHLCDRGEALGDFYAQLERARDHYEAETAGEVAV